MTKILVIEDNIEVRENLCEILELAQYETISAENGKIGVSKAISEQPDLILCDIMMPMLDGNAVLKILSKNEETSEIPFVFLTARTEMADFRKGMSMGADDYITKPFDDSDLLESIEIRLIKQQNCKKSTSKVIGKKGLLSPKRLSKELFKLTKGAELRKYLCKEHVYQEKGQAHWVYYIIKGKVRTYRVNEMGKELTTTIYKNGDFFGYLPFFSSRNYINNAQAIEKTELALVSEKSFYEIFNRDPDFTMQFIKRLTQELEKAEQQLIEMAYGSVRRKIANTLLKVYEKNELSQKIVRLSRDDLAAIAATAKETLIRTLSDFKSEGLILIEKEGVIILDEIKLKKIPQ